MRKPKISMMYALPCLASAAVLYAANRLRKENKTMQRRARVYQEQTRAFERCLAEVDLRNARLQARLEGCRQGRDRDAKENEKLRSELLARGKEVDELKGKLMGCRLAAGEKVKELEEELAECKEKYEHLECHHEELMADERAVRKELEQTKLELAQVRSASRDILAETMAEVKWLYEYLDAEGYPEEQTRDFARQEFHGQVPSEIYRRQQNEQAMQAALAAEPRDGETE